VLVVYICLDRSRVMYATACTCAQSIEWEKTSVPFALGTADENKYFNKIENDRKRSRLYSLKSRSTYLAIRPWHSDPRARLQREQKLRGTLCPTPACIRRFHLWLWRVSIGSKQDSRQLTAKLWATRYIKEKLSMSINL
jgi:hypothetical protein